MILIHNDHISFCSSCKHSYYFLLAVVESQVGLFLLLHSFLAWFLVASFVGLWCSEYTCLIFGTGPLLLCCLSTSISSLVMQLSNQAKEIEDSHAYHMTSNLSWDCCAIYQQWEIIRLQAESFLSACKCKYMQHPSLIMKLTLVGSIQVLIPNYFLKIQWNSNSMTDSTVGAIISKLLS